MRLKKYLDFIKESIKEDIEEKSIWKITEDDIQEIFLESVDEGYYIDIEFGFVESKQHRSFRDKKDIFTDKVIAGDKIRPAYLIYINTSEKVTSEDVTSNLKFAMSIIAEKAKADITIQDDYNVLDVDKVKIQGGLYADVNTPVVGGYISLFVKQKETVEFTPKDIIEYYDIKIDENTEIRGENVYLHVELENLADCLLSNKSDHKNTLVNGMIDEFWDYYNASDYTPDDISFLQYTLSKENSILLVKSIIKEMGLDQTINHIGDECSDESYESVKGKSEEEIIDFLLKERFYTTLRQLFKDSEVCKEVKYFVALNEMDAHALENYKQVVREFDDIVEKELGPFQKIKKELTKYYKTKDSEGNQIKYKEEVDFYILPFNNDWLVVHDVDFIKSESFSTIFNEYCVNFSPSCSLNPNFSDYGDVDSKELNREINVGLNRYLEKGYTGLN